MKNKVMDMGTLLDNFKKWAFDNLVDCIKAEGELVTKDQALKRIEICNGCDKSGTVTPVPGLHGPGCIECGCPFATKPWMKTILRDAQNAGQPITFEEILKLKTLGTFNKSKFIKEKIVCPHSSGNKWEAVDSKFL